LNEKKGGNLIGNVQPRDILACGKEKTTKRVKGGGGHPTCTRGFVKSLAKEEKRPTWGGSEATGARGVRNFCLS